MPLADNLTAEAWLEAQIGGYPDEILTSEARSYTGADSRPPVDPRVRLGKPERSLFDMWTAVARGSQMFLLRVQTALESWPDIESQGNAFVDSFALQSPMPFGASRDDSLFQYWGEIITIDPALSRSGAGDIAGAIFSGLVKLDTNVKVVGDMAESWKVSSDGTVFTFVLKDNALFHDGRAVTAEDFKYSLGTGPAPPTRTHPSPRPIWGTSWEPRRWRRGKLGSCKAWKSWTTERCG